MHANNKEWNLRKDRLRKKLINEFNVYLWGKKTVLQPSDAKRIINNCFGDEKHEK